MHLSPAWRCLPLLVLLFVCWILSCVADDISTEDGSGVTKLTLRPDVPARHRYLPAQQNSDDLPRHLLLLSGLQANSVYEVRVSYLGTAPYAAMLALHCSAASPASRTLLDIEKITLSTDAQGGVIGCAESQATVELSFAFTGRGPTAEREAGVRQRPVEYVAVCESLLVPGLPRYIPAVGLLCLAVLAAAFRWLVPALIAHVQHMTGSSQHKQR